MPDPMLLSAASVQWLQGLPGVVTAEDLDVTYRFSHPLNQSRQLAKETLTLDLGDANLLWWVRFFTSEQEEVLDPPLARRIFSSTQLRSVRESGPVALNALFMVKERFKRQGLANSLYEAELRLYRK